MLESLHAATRRPFRSVSSSATLSGKVIPLPVHNAAASPLRPDIFQPIHPVKRSGGLFGMASANPAQWAYGAQTVGHRVRFKLWAPQAKTVEVVKLRALTPTEKQVNDDYAKIQQQLTLEQARKTILSEQDYRNWNHWNKQTRERNADRDTQLQQIDAKIAELNRQAEALREQVVPLQARFSENDVFPMLDDGAGSFHLESTDFKGSRAKSTDKPIEPGTLYMYRLTYEKGKEPRWAAPHHDRDSQGQLRELLPDPRSRFQPEDVNGPSEVVGSSFQWSAEGEAFWNAPKDTRKAVLYRLHLGTFTPEGRIQSLLKKREDGTCKLDDMQAMGYTGLELMPVTEFPGQRNWGYDPQYLYAVENAYGRPEDLKQLSDELKKRNMLLILDVVYNHIGPEGNYLDHFDADFLQPHATPWGPRLNFDHQNPAYRAQHTPRNAPSKHAPAMDFALDNVKYWTQEFRVDGFRFDQTPHIPERAMRQMTQALYEVRPSSDISKPKVILMAEDGREQNFVTSPPHDHIADWAGLGFKGQWLFKFYHGLRSVLTGKPHENLSTHVGDFVHSLWRGFRDGEGWLGNLSNAVLFADSHDEAGNHDGSRMHKLLEEEPGKAKIAMALPYLLPGIPFNFMGHEYGETAPFYYFVDHQGGDLIWNMSRDRWTRPQPGMASDKSTFEASKLSWQSYDQMPIANKRFYDFNKAVVQLRQSVPALWQGDRYDKDGKRLLDFHNQYLPSDVMVVHRKGFVEPEEGVNYQDEVFIVSNFSGWEYHQEYNVNFPPGEWEEVLNSEDEPFSGRPGWTNKGKTFSEGTSAITLPGNSVAIFRKKQSP